MLWRPPSCPRMQLSAGLPGAKLATSAMRVLISSYWASRMSQTARLATVGSMRLSAAGRAVRCASSEAGRSQLFDVAGRKESDSGRYVKAHGMVSLRPLDLASSGGLLTGRSQPANHAVRETTIEPHSHAGVTASMRMASGLHVRRRLWRQSAFPRAASPRHRDRSRSLSARRCSTLPPRSSPGARRRL